MLEARPVSEQSQVLDPAFDACIVTYNSEAVIEPLLRSLAQESHLRLIRVFDNASTDATVTRVEETAPSLAVPVEVTRSPANLGFPAACNRLFQEVTSPVIALINP